LAFPAGPALLHFLDRLEEFLETEWLEQGGGKDRADEIIGDGVSAPPRHENKTFTELWARPIDCVEEQIARQTGHHHVAEDHREVAREHF
jgi:hypothetical protein